MSRAAGKRRLPRSRLAGLLTARAATLQALELEDNYADAARTNLRVPLRNLTASHAAERRAAEALFR